MFMIQSIEIEKIRKEFIWNVKKTNMKVFFAVLILVIIHRAWIHHILPDN